MIMFVCHVMNISTRHYNYKFAIKSVSLFKYFKLSSLLCSGYHSLHFCSISQWQWQGKRFMNGFSASTECRHSSNIRSYQHAIVRNSNRFYNKLVLDAVPS